jgi:hypothetical protein
MTAKDALAEWTAVTADARRCLGNQEYLQWIADALDARLTPDQARRAIALYQAENKHDGREDG